MDCREKNYNNNQPPPLPGEASLMCLHVVLEQCNRRPFLKFLLLVRCHFSKSPRAYTYHHQHQHQRHRPTNHTYFPIDVIDTGDRLILVSSISIFYFVVSIQFCCPPPTHLDLTITPTPPIQRSYLRLPAGWPCPMTGSRSLAMGRTGTRGTAPV